MDAEAAVARITTIPDHVIPASQAEIAPATT